MSYIVPSELPKSCSECSFCYLIMQNPLSSKTPIKRYRCQVGKAPWRTFDVDFYDDEYKDKDCPLVSLERIVQRLEERLEEQVKLYAIAFDPEDRGGYDAYSDAIEIVKEEGEMDD